MFGVVFPNRSFPMDISTFAQIDTFHWILDMNTFVGEAYDQVREICIFLLNSFTLPKRSPFTSSRRDRLSSSSAPSRSPVPPPSSPCRGRIPAVPTALASCS